MHESNEPKMLSYTPIKRHPGALISSSWSMHLLVKTIAHAIDELNAELDRSLDSCEGNVISFRAQAWIILRQLKEIYLIIKDASTSMF